MSTNLPNTLDSTVNAEEGFAPATARHHRALVFKTVEDLYNEKSLPWLVKEVLPVGAFGMLYGNPSMYKSFCALDLAMSIATGSDWHGRPVTSGPVLFISAEGNTHLRYRIQAWEREHAAPRTSEIRFLTQSIAMGDATIVRNLLSLIEEEFNPLPVLVIIDTLARCFGSGDENAAQDMNRFVEGIDRLRERGITVLVIHHKTKNGADPRGSSALTGALDTMIEIARAEKMGKDAVRLACKKQKDGSEGPLFTLLPRLVELDDGRSSVVLDFLEGGKWEDEQTEVVRKTKKRHELIADVLREHGPQDFLTLREKLIYMGHRWSEKKLRRDLKSMEAANTMHHWEVGQSGKHMYDLGIAPERSAAVEG